MSKKGADKRYEMTELLGRVGDGIAKGTGAERQTVTARKENAETEQTVTIEEVLQRDNMIRAYQRVVRNGGASGVDGVTVDNLMEYSRMHWSRISREITEGKYIPSAVRKVEIPKSGGKGTRVLGIPTVMDRMIQQALLQVLTPVFEPTFSEWSFGFRPGRGAHDAVLAAKEHMAAGHRWVVDMDLEKFFDRVNHDVLMSRIARRVKDKEILRLIRRFLQSGMMEGGVASPRSEGTPQGGPLSPLLSNALLDEFDKELEKRGHRFARYADDCNVYVKSRAAGERVMASLEKFLEKRLRLKINRDKSAVARPWERSFLGYSVTTNLEPKLKVSPESAKRLKNKLKTIFRRGRGRNLSRMIKEELIPVIRGWTAYFKLVEVKNLFLLLDEWLRHRLRSIMWRQWKKPRTRLKKLIALGLTEERAAKSAYNGRGPWWNSGMSHMNQAVPKRMLEKMGLINFFDEYRRLESNM